MVKPPTSPAQLALLERTLGIRELAAGDREKLTSLDSCPRNFLVTCEAADGWGDLCELADRGLMTRAELPRDAGTAMFHVADHGFSVLRAHGRVPLIQRELFA